MDHYNKIFNINSKLLMNSAHEFSEDNNKISYIDYLRGLFYDDMTKKATYLANEIGNIIINNKETGKKKMLPNMNYFVPSEISNDVTGNYVCCIYRQILEKAIHDKGLIKNFRIKSKFINGIFVKECDTIIIPNDKYPI